MSSTPETGLQRQVAPVFSLVPSSLGEAMEMAKLITGSDLCPKAYKGKPADAIVAYDYGRNLGLSWMQALRSVSVINGNTSLWGDAVPALILGSGTCERFKESFEGKPYEDDYRAVCIIKRKGLQDEVVRTFSVAQAKLAHLWQKRGRDGQETPWVTYPDRMLQMRARGFGARDAYADKLSGLILAEEAMDYPDAIDAEVVHSAPAVNLLDRLPEGLRDNIEKAFATLALPPGLRIAKLNEFLGGVDVATPEEGAEKLLLWCRDEFSKRKTGKAVQRDPDNGKKTKAPWSPEGKPETRVAPSAGDSATASPARDAVSPAVAPSSAPVTSTQPATASLGTAAGSVADTRPPQGAEVLF